MLHEVYIGAASGATGIETLQVAPHEWRCTVYAPRSDRTVTGGNEAQARKAMHELLDSENIFEEE